MQPGCETIGRKNMKNKVIKSGTIITIDHDFINRVECAVDNGILTERDYEQWCWGVYKKWLPRDIVFNIYRVNRKFQTLGWTFLDEDLATLPHYNMTIFKALEYEIEYPDQLELDVCTCPDQFLTTKEIVYKQLVLNNPTRTREWSDEVMLYIVQAMEATGVVFYIP